MAIKPLEQINLPQFDMPDKYKADVWNVRDWDCYKNASSSSKTYWDRRSKITNYRLDFTLCKNLYVREEFKFIFYIALEKTNVSVGTLGEKYDFFKKVAKFVNEKWMDKTTIVDSEVSFLYQRYCLLVLKNKLTIKNGTYINMTEKKKVIKSKKNPCITFLETAIFDLQYYDKSLSLMDRDIWIIKDIYPDSDLTGRRFNFTRIKNPEYKFFVKKYCKQKATTLVPDTVYNLINNISIFFEWLYEEHPEIDHLNKLNREILEEYFFWLRVETDYSSHKANIAIVDLKCFFDYGDFLQFENFPSENLILRTDYCFRGHTESKYFTDEELNSIIKIIPKMPLIVGKMVSTLISTGLRISELLNLGPEQIIKKNDDYILLIYQSKTYTYYEMPIKQELGELLINEIEINKKKFNCEPEYVFLNEEGRKVHYVTLTRKINKCIFENNVLDRNGELLRCNTHRFRATKATMLINAGVAPKEISQVLGHANLASLSSYAAVTNDTLHEAVKARFDKINIMIQNIGKIDDTICEPIKDAIPLCNGFCTKPLETGICAKANSCLECSLFVPSKQYLTAYKLQLNEVNAALSMATVNNYEILISKLEKDKTALESVIQKVETKLEEHNDG